MGKSRKQLLTNHKLILVILFLSLLGVETVLKGPYNEFPKDARYEGLKYILGVGLVRLNTINVQIAFLTISSTCGFSSLFLFFISFSYKQVTSNGNQWKRHRQLINPAFHAHKLKSLLPLFAKYTLVCVDSIEKYMSRGEPEQTREGHTGIHIPFYDESRQTTADIICDAGE